MAISMIAYLYLRKWGATGKGRPPGAEHDAAEASPGDSWRLRGRPRRDGRELDAIRHARPLARMRQAILA